MTSTGSTRPSKSPKPLAPLELLHTARHNLPADLPPSLSAIYGSPLDLTRPTLYANFVSTLDGVVALPDIARSNAIISAESTADRFVMGLLRAAADVVLIGSGTLHGSPRTLWTAEHAYPPLAPEYAELRHSRGLPKTPALAIVTGSGDINPTHPALENGALVLTTTRGAHALRGRVPAAAIIPLGDEVTPNPEKIVAALRARGHQFILSEAGPHLFGSLLACGLVDELFLTFSPLLAGRAAPGSAFNLVEGTALLPDAQVEGSLRTAHRHGSYLFLRYDISRRS